MKKKRSTFKLVTHDKLSKFTFGKHKDETVGEVLEDDPTYIVWVSENVWWFHISKEIVDEAKEVFAESLSQRRRFYRSYYNDDIMEQEVRDYYIY